MHYLVTTGYETDRVDNEGNARVVKVKNIVEAETAEEVSIVMAKYRAEDSRASKVIGIVESPIECVIDPKNEPRLYTS